MLLYTINGGERVLVGLKKMSETLKKALALDLCWGSFLLL